MTGYVLTYRFSKWWIWNNLIFTVATLPFVLYLDVCGSKVGNPFSRPFLTFYKVKGRKLLVLALLFQRTYLSLVRFLAVAKLLLLAYPVMQVLHHPGTGPLYTRVQKFNHTSYSLLNKPPWYSKLWDGQGRASLFVSWRRFLLCPWHLRSQFSRFSRKMDFWEKLSKFD